MKGDKVIKIFKKGSDPLLFWNGRNKDFHIFKLAMCKNALACTFCCHCKLAPNSIIQTP